MSQNKSSKTDQILDLLLDALLERQNARGEDQEPGTEPTAADQPPQIDSPAVDKRGADQPPKVIQTGLGEGDKMPTVVQSAATPEGASFPPATPITPKNEPLDSVSTADADEADPLPPIPAIPEKLPSIKLERMLGRLTVALLALIVLVNLPFNRYGTSLARALPDQKALIIRDGLVLKGSGPNIYVLEGNQRRWISSLQAFEDLGYRWEQVNIVEDQFLERFPEGRPVHLLLKCSTSPHVYAFENGQKRWIKDIATFTDEGYVWEDVQIVTCPYLRNLPDGRPIPIDAGEPPQP